MKSIKYFAVIFMLLASIVSCEKKDIDKEKPSIDLTIQDAFPVNCDTLYFDETFILKVSFTDNVELGSFSIDIHNNFDHHSHSTEVTECDLDPIKSPVNPYTTIGDFDIPAGVNEYITDLSISLPSGNEDGLFDDGDYHFYFSLTDKEGWSVQKGLSIKMLHH